MQNLNELCKIKWDAVHALQKVNNSQETNIQNISYLGGWKDSPTCRHSLYVVICTKQAENPITIYTVSLLLGSSTSKNKPKLTRKAEDLLCPILNQLWQTNAFKHLQLQWRLQRKFNKVIQNSRIYWYLLPLQNSQSCTNKFSWTCDTKLKTDFIPLNLNHHSQFTM